MLVTRDVAGRLAMLALAVFASCLLAGCASMSVAHLESRPFFTTTQTTLPMKFWRFEFAGVIAGGAFEIRGRAMPMTDSLPPWVDSLEELTLTAYLRDGAGNVLAMSEKRYKGLPLRPGAAVPFEFAFSPVKAPPGGYAVSFGYKAVFGSQKARATLAVNGPLPAGAVFFASEGAVLKQ
ncbi:MAG: hypothetical protein AB9872_16110 [Solidesulfovibrio sp.]